MPDLKYRGTCYTDPTYSEGCTFLAGSVMCTVSNDNFGGKVDSSIEKLGPKSRCANIKTGSADSKPKCVEQTCTSNVITYKLSGGQTCTCDASNQGTDAVCGTSDYKVTCPASVSDVCLTLNSACPNDCSGKGLCLGPSGTRKCFCMYGYSGNDCSGTNTSEGTPVLTTPKADGAPAAPTPTPNNSGSNANSLQIGSLVLAVLGLIYLN